MMRSTVASQTSPTTSLSHMAGKLSYGLLLGSSYFWVIWLALLLVTPLAHALEIPPETLALAEVEECQNKASRPKFVIVGPYSTGIIYSPELQKLGVSKEDIIAVHSAPWGTVMPLWANSYRGDGDFGLVVNPPAHGDIVGAIVEQIRAYVGDAPIAGVFTGAEIAGEISDAVAAALGVRRNVDRLTLARRDKAIMHQKLRERGIPAMHDLVATRIDDIISWIHDPNGNAGAYPVVLKPRNSAATDGVKICQNEREVRIAFAELMGYRSLTGNLVQEVLVQSFLEGTEVVVNTVSYNGVHVAVEFFEYEKTDIDLPNGGGKARVYVADRLIDPKSERARLLQEYAFRVLDAVGIQNGPGHMEIMETKRGGQVLVEVGARLEGGQMQNITRVALPTSQLDLDLMARLRPREFLAIAQQYAAEPPKLLAHGIAYQMISHQQGVIREVNSMVLNEIRGLSTHVADTLGSLTPGKQIQLTVDMQTSPAWIQLVGTEEQIRHDTARLRELEKILFVVDPIPISTTR